MTTELRTLVFKMREEATLQEMTEELRSILLGEPVTKKEMEIITNLQIEEGRLVAMEEGRLEQMSAELRKFVKNMQ
jgi:hypothetical protein